jgi:hypothetical protein
MKLSSTAPRRKPNMLLGASDHDRVCAGEEKLC